MLASFLIMLREGLEAALIVGIIAGYLARTGRGAFLPAVWVGVLFAVALSLFAGAAVIAIGAQFPQKIQELFEAIVGLLAVVLLISMVFWMRKAARSMRATMEHDIDVAMADLRGPTWALIGMSFFAVGREGLESVFFLLALFQQSPGPGAPLGALRADGLAEGCGAARSSDGTDWFSRRNAPLLSTLAEESLSRPWTDSRLDLSTPGPLDAWDPRRLDPSTPGPPDA